MTAGSLLASLAVDAPGAIAQLADLLRTGRLSLPVTRGRLEYALHTYDDRTMDKLVELVNEWPVGGEEGRAALVAAVEAALDVRRVMAGQSTSCEVVWTGKGSTSGVRSTVPVILEMLDAAQKSVLLLSYAVWLKQVKVNGVVDRLAGLSGRGVNIAWIVDARYREGHNVAELVDHWPRGHHRPSVYQWVDLDDEIAKLHAKVMIVDDRDALVTSANLTGHGLTSNLELGLRVQGAPARSLAAHLRHLMATGVFERFDWPSVAP